LVGAVACTNTQRDLPSADRPFRVVDAWARTADSGTTGGAYISVTNVDTVSVVITSVSSTDAQSAELHESMQHDGMVHMTARPLVQIVRDSTLSMVPGGVHVMLNGLTRALAQGDSLTVTFGLADGRQVPVRVGVRAP
jgi:periplasmic copper chaperone A